MGVPRRSTMVWLSATAVAVPALAWVAALAVDGDATDALLNTAALLVIVAPLVGVGCVSRRKADAAGGTPLRAALGPLAAWAIGAVAVSAIAAGSTFGPDALGFVATSHLAIGAVTLALAAVGGLLAAWIAEPLDAAAASVAAAVTAGAGLLVAGSWTGSAPPVLVAVAIQGNPFVAMASAAHIDVARLELFYRISPLAHLGVEYPAWYSTCAWYALVAAACFIGVGAKSSTPRPGPGGPTLSSGLEA